MRQEKGWCSSDAIGTFKGFKETDSKMYCQEWQLWRLLFYFSSLSFLLNVRFCPEKLRDVCIKDLWKVHDTMMMRHLLTRAAPWVTQPACSWLTHLSRIYHHLFPSSSHSQRSSLSPRIFFPLWSMPHYRRWLVLCSMTVWEMPALWHCYKWHH